MISKKILISGLVQGVFFRASMKEKADALGIRGWVYNTDDGDVEVRAEGDETAVQTLIEWCHKGPEDAQVTSVEEEDVTEEGFTSFEIKH